MVVHDLASYVKYHQQKLREQQTQSAAASRPTPQRKKWSGVNSLYSKADFEKVVNESVSAQDGSPKVLLFDAFATWCGPCKAIAPQIAEWSNGQYSDKVGFFKFDVDQVSDLAQELGVRAMPTFFIFKNGEMFEQVVGANPKAISSVLDKALAA